MQGGKEALLLQQLIVLRVKTMHAQATEDWHCNNKQSLFSAIDVYTIGIVRQWKSREHGRSQSGCKYLPAQRGIAITGTTEWLLQRCR